VKILLDIDGVMVPAASWKPAEILTDGFAAFSKKAVTNLQKIIVKTGASIVLTTSHKANYSLHEWKNIFNLRGISVSIDKLEHNTGNLSRKDEILNWLNTQKHDEIFVIIDDDKSLNDLPNQIKNKLILTSPMVGLTNYDADIAIEVLRSAELSLA